MRFENENGKEDPTGNRLNGIRVHLPYSGLEVINLSFHLIFKASTKHYLIRYLLVEVQIEQGGLGGITGQGHRSNLSAVYHGEFTVDVLRSVC